MSPSLVPPTASLTVSLPLYLTVSPHFPAPHQAPLADAFYTELPAQLSSQWAAWLRKYHQALAADGPRAAAAARMRLVNPKYVPREWMLVEAYELAALGDYTLVSPARRIVKDLAARAQSKGT